MIEFDRPEDIHIWRLRLSMPPSVLARFESVLSPNERAQSLALAQSENRDRFAASHAGLRSILSKYVPVPARDLRFSRTPSGKPVLLSSQACELDFSWSHSAEQGIVAVSQGRPVGVDIQFCSGGLDVGAVGRTVFSTVELELLDRLDGSERERAFFEMWVRKEALLKGTGRGLVSNPEATTATFHWPAQDAIVDIPSATGSEPVEIWHVKSIPCDPTYMAAVCARGPIGHVLSMGDWPELDKVSDPPMRRTNGPEGRSLKTGIRKSRASDIEPLVALSRRTISHSYRPFLGDAAVDGFLESGSADDFVRDNIDRCWVIERNGTIAGYSVIRGNVIELMMIDFALHRQGLGAELLAFVEETLWRDHLEIRLESFGANAQANGFYRKHGWRETGRFRDPDAGVDKISFRKESPK